MLTASFIMACRSCLEGLGPSVTEHKDLPLLAHLHGASFVGEEKMSTDVEVFSLLYL